MESVSKVCSNYSSQDGRKVVRVDRLILVVENGNRSLQLFVYNPKALFYSISFKRGISQEVKYVLVYMDEWNTRLPPCLELLKRVIFCVPFLYITLFIIANMKNIYAHY